MRIADCLSEQRPSFSFEFFPPKTKQGVAGLFRTISSLNGLDPSFVSVTYGAGGSTRALTLSLVERIKRKTGIEAMAHLTCVGHSRAELREVLSELHDAGIENVLALRGDPPRGQGTFVRPEDGLGFASELAAFIREGFDFCIGGACYPEGHIECPDRDQDLENLKRKVDAGVDFLITQLFFDNAFYFEFVERARKAGIGCRIIPGIMPVTNIHQLERFTLLCGAAIPYDFRRRLYDCKDEDAVIREGIARATEQCRELLERGAPGIHFYTLNKSFSTFEVMRNLADLRAPMPAAKI